MDAFTIPGLQSWGSGGMLTAYLQALMSKQRRLINAHFLLPQMLPNIIGACPKDDSAAGFKRFD